LLKKQMTLSWKTEIHFFGHVMNLLIVGHFWEFCFRPFK
jgi:hypothetical protein